jgi:alkylation response protein AidB-like acyl-CoA dehydrogenase
MNFGDSDAVLAARAQARAALATAGMRAELAALAAAAEPDVRPLYREVARLGLLALSWPVEYGGRGGSHAEAAAAIEELVRGGMPDMLQVLSIQIVGLFLLQAGTPAQQATHLPALAAGERFATVLYTEPEVGSDLAALRATGVRDGAGYRLNGVKVYGLKSQLSDLGLCAVRTGRGASKYDGISLFLLDLHADGVRRSHVASGADEQFDRVELTDVWVGEDALLGAEGEGWSLLTRCLAIERTGLDYSLKAARWFDAGLAGLVADEVDDALREQVGRNGAAVDVGRMLAWNSISLLDRGALPTAAAAMAKYHTSETAAEMAVWAALTHGHGYGLADLDDATVATLDSGYREAPGLTLSAGTSQMMLELVASTFDRPDATASHPAPAPARGSHATEGAPGGSAA